MNVSLYIARRLSLKTGKKRATSPGIIVGYIGVALAISIMLLSIFVVNGFKKEIREKLIGFNAPITIYAPENSESPAFTSGIQLTDTLRELIVGTLPETTPSLIIQQPAIFKTENDFQGIILKGVEPTASGWDFFKENLIEGNVPSADDGENAILISAVTASRLGINAGDKLTTHFLDNNNIRTRKLTVTGVFETHFHDFDNAYAATPISMLQNLNHVDSITGTAIELRPVEFDSITAKASELNNIFISAAISNPANNDFVRVHTLQDSCGQYLSWLDLLDTNVIVIIILMACVSGFTLISSLFIIILEHVNTIGLLKAVGATNSQIRRIFIYMAERLVAKGIIIGDLIAIALAYVQMKWQLIPLDPEAYYLNNVPIDFSWLMILVINAAAIVIAAIVLILPSHLIARLSPSTSLRYE